MQTTMPKTVSDLRLIGMFSLILVGLVVLLNIVTHFFEFENAAMGLLIVFVAGMAVGNNWATSEKARPSSGRAWKIAVYCALVATVVSAIVLVLVLGADDAFLDEVRYAMGGGGPLLILVAASAIQVLIVRLGIWLGLKQGMKMLEKEG